MTQRPARLLLLASCLAIAVPATSLGAQTKHRLMPTPETVAVGHYWSETKPVLRIKSGDEVTIGKVNTLLDPETGAPSAELAAQMAAMIGLLASTAAAKTELA